MRDSDWWLKKVWLVNGALLLLFLVLGGVAIVVGTLSDLMGGGGGAVPVQPVGDRAAEERPRAVRYGAPVRVRGTETRMVLVSHGREYSEGGSARGGDLYSGSGVYTDGPTVNVLFLDPSGAGRLLLDRPAYIERVSHPAGEEGTVRVPVASETEDTLQTWIAYEMALDDTNGDRKLDARDRRALYVTALDGTGLRRVLPGDYRPRSFQALEGGRMLVLALDARGAGARTDEDALPQRAFVYDVAAGRLRPYAALDSLSAAAGRIVGR